MIELRIDRGLGETYALRVIRSPRGRCGGLPKVALIGVLEAEQTPECLKVFRFRRSGQADIVLPEDRTAPGPVAAAAKAIEQSENILDTAFFPDPHLQNSKGHLLQITNLGGRDKGCLEGDYEVRLDRVKIGELLNQPRGDGLGMWLCIKRALAVAVDYVRFIHGHGGGQPRPGGPNDNTQQSP